MSKLDPKISFKTFLVDLDEIPDKMDIDIKLPVKKASEAAKPVLKRDSKTIQLF